jgi:predicted nucleic acid-binding protein
MLAIDTNIVVRYLTADHLDQSARAKQLIENEEVLVSVTVLLEAEWVLRSVYGYGADKLVKVLRAFAGLPRVTIEDSVPAALALDWMERGLDFADALHLARTGDAMAFVTFDERFARKANALGTIKVRAP